MRPSAAQHARAAPPAQCGGGGGDTVICPLAMLDQDTLRLIAAHLGPHRGLAARSCRALRAACSAFKSGTSLAAVTTVPIAELWSSEVPAWRDHTPCMIAARNDAVAVLQWARARGAGAPSAKRALAAACGAGSLRVAERLLAEACSRDDMHIALEFAARAGHAPAVELLLRVMAAADNDAGEEQAEATPRPAAPGAAAASRAELLADALAWACEAGRLSCARRLLDLGARVRAAHQTFLNSSPDPSPPDPRRNALWSSCVGAHDGVLRLLLERGASATWRRGGAVDPPLFVACAAAGAGSARPLACLRALLAAGADAREHVTADGLTALHAVCENDAFGGAEPPPAARGEGGGARGPRRAEPAAALREGGAEALEPEPGTPLGRQLEAARLLLDSRGGVDVDARGCEGSTALDSLCARGHAACAALLLQRGASANGADSGGRTALHVACAAGRERCAALLLENGADARALDGRGRTPLRSACVSGRASCVCLLLGRGVVDGPAVADAAGACARWLADEFHASDDDEEPEACDRAAARDGWRACFALLRAHSGGAAARPEQPERPASDDATLQGGHGGL